MINIKEKKREFLMFFLDKPLKKVLDVGCGRALMSKFFAKRDIRVRGIDKQRLCEDFENFEFIKGNILEEEFEDNYDLIMASLMLHFFNPKDAEKIIGKIKKSTISGGYNFIICMSNQDGLSKKDKFFPRIEDLIESYKDWTLIKKFQDFTKFEDHPPMGGHRHNLIFLIFKKTLKWIN